MTFKASSSTTIYNHHSFILNHHSQPFSSTTILNHHLQPPSSTTSLLICLFSSQRLLEKLINIAKHHILTRRCVLPDLNISTHPQHSLGGGRGGGGGGMACLRVLVDEHCGQHSIVSSNLQQVIFLPYRIDRVIQELSDEIHDPLISCHWSSLSTETSSFASIYIGLENRVER
jgi:hypothetical protein